MRAHTHPHEHPRRPWGVPRPGLLSRLAARIRRLVPSDEGPEPEGLPELPLALRRGELGAAYLGAGRGGEDQRGGEGHRRFAPPRRARKVAKLSC